MLTTLKKWEIRDNNNNLISSGALKLNGTTYELHTLKEIINVGIEAERNYQSFRDTNKMLADLQHLNFYDIQ